MNGKTDVEDESAVGGPSTEPVEADEIDLTADPPKPAEDAGSSQGLLGLMTPAYILGAALLWGMVQAAGFWEVIADTRALAVLLDLGIVALGEEDPGLMSLPAVEYFTRSQEPVVW